MCWSFFNWIVSRGTIGLYLPKSTKSTEMSLGETPGILLACAIVSGLIAVSFSLASVDNDWMPL